MGAGGGTQAAQAPRQGMLRAGQGRGRGGGGARELMPEAAPGSE